MASYKRPNLSPDPAKILKLIENGLTAGKSVEFFRDDDGEIYAVVWLDKDTRWSRHHRVS